MGSEYRPQVVADLHRRVAAALPRWGLSPQAGISVLSLSENATFAVDDRDRDRRLVIRVHRIGYSSAQEIRSELAWIDALSREGVVETAPPVPGRDGELLQTLESSDGGPSRHAVAFLRLDGEAPSGCEDAGPWFERLGELTARMHRHARTWSRPSGFDRGRWDLEAMVGPRARWGPWRAALGLTTAGRDILERALARIEQRLAHFGTSRDRFGLVHADLHLANLLVQGTRLQIIDFDDCGFGWFMYDFAAAISFIEQQANLPQLLDAWTRGYRRLAGLSREELAEIPTFVVLRRILLSAWIASHREVPAAQQIGEDYTQGMVELAERFLRGELLAGR